MSLEPRSEAGRRSLAVLFFTALAAALFFQALFSGKLIYGYDTLVLGVPFHAEALRCLDAGQWPLWMPDILGGMPGIASCNLIFSYPTHFVGYLARLNFPRLLGLDASFNVLAAGMGMFLLLRRMKVSFPAALLGAFFFAVSGSELSQLYGGYFNIMEAVAWTPWVFWAAHKGLRERSWAGWGLCGAALALQILAVGTQLCFYTLAALACFTWIAARSADAGRGPLKKSETRWEATQGLALALLLTALLAAPQIWPTLRYLPYTSRPAWDPSILLQGAIRPSEALAWIVPGFFGWQMPTYHGGMSCIFTTEYLGLLPLCLASSALAALWRREPRVRRLVALSLGAFFFAQNRWTPFYALFRHVPILSGFRIWSRVLFLDSVTVCVLAALGFDALLQAKTRAAALRGALAFLVLAASLTLAAWFLAPAQALEGAAAVAKLGYPSDPGQAAILLTGLARDSALRSLGLLALLAALLGLFWRQPRLAPALVLSFAFHTCDQSVVFNHFVNFMDPRAAVAHPDLPQALPEPAGLEPWRIYDFDTTYPNEAMRLGYENLAGKESVPLKNSDDLAHALSGRPHLFYDLLGERYWFSHKKRSGRIENAPDQVDVYENPSAYPRAWLVGKTLAVSGEAAAYALLADRNFDPRDEAALPLDLGLSGAAPRGSVRWLARSPLRFRLAVDTDRPAALVVSNFWYPAWKASVDGKETPVLKADGALQAVAMPQGRHQVDFYYDESLFNAALAACLAGLTLLAGLLWMERAGA